MTTTDEPRRAILLGRLSDNREEDEVLTEDGIPLALEDQLERMTERTKELGWTVWKTLKNPRLSAYKKRVVTLPDGRRDYRVFRPDLREALDDLASGRANAMVCLDLDRAFRDPQDLRDLINVVEYSKHSIIVESVTGSLHMEKGYDNFNAEIRVLVANKSSRDTARRVASSRKKRAYAGKFGGGPRPFGFKADGVTVDPVEAAVIADCSNRVLEIDGKTKKLTSLRFLVRELNAGDVPTVTGATWSTRTLKGILLRPRNVGRMEYRGEEVGAAPWAPIVPEEIYRAVCRLLDDPSRVTNTGAAPRFLGSGLYLCGVCKDGTTCGVNGGTKHAPRYRCKVSAHITRNAAQLDQFVEDAFVARLCVPGVIERFLHRVKSVPVEDVAALRAEAKAIRVRLNGLAKDRALGEIDREAMLEGTKAGQARLTVIRDLLMDTTVDSPLTAFADAEGPEEVLAIWLAQPLGTQRAMLRAVMAVTVNLTGRKGRVFDASAVRIAWQTPDAAAAS